MLIRMSKFKKDKKRGAEVLKMKVQELGPKG